jgi:alpha-L-fucosidase
MFSDAGPDVRWIGNEQGTAGDPNWSTVDPDTVPVPGLGGDAVVRQLQHGDAEGTVWRPGECDVSIRPGWFHHAAEDGRVRDGDDLVRLYFESVGRNSKLLLNVPATTAGLLHDVDVARLDAMHSSLTRLFEERVASIEFDVAEPDAQRSVEVSLEGAPAVAIAELRENIRNGQAVARYRLEGYDGAGWSVLARGTTIGHCKLDRLAPGSPRRVRLTVEDAIDWPVQVRLSLFAAT